MLGPATCIASKKFISKLESKNTSWRRRGGGGGEINKKIPSSKRTELIFFFKSTIFSGGVLVFAYTSKSIQWNLQLH